MAKVTPEAARELLAARARRAARIRRRVVATAVAAFVLAWCVIAYGGPMGAPTTTATASSNATASGSDNGSSATASSSDYGSSSSGPAAVTTAPS